MRKFLKVTGLSLLSLVIVLIATFGIFRYKVEKKRTTPLSPSVTSFELPTDEASLAEGKRLVQVKACADCHGQDLAGKTFVSDPALGSLTGSNLTPGKGSRVFNYQTQDWIRAIRYAVGPDGLPLIAMPAGDFHGISNQELAKMIAYLKSLAPVDRENPPQKLGPMAYVLTSLGKLPLIFPFEEVNFKDTPVENVEAGITLEYGKYLSMACTGCHGPGFGGGHIPGTPPQWPDAKNITPGGAFGKWTFEDFKKVLTTGQTPDGHQIDAQFMPWKSMQAMNETEMKALFLYLQQVPAKPEGSR